MHEQEVGGVGLLALHLGDPGGHGYGGDAGGADEGVDLLLHEEVHELGQEHTAGGAEAKGDDAHEHNSDGLEGQEGGGGSGGAHGDAQEDGDDVHQLVLGGLLQAVHHAGLLHEVAQHQAGDQGPGGGHQQGNEHGDHDGEDDLLTPGDLPQGAHDDPALLGGGEGPHDGGLDDRHQGHVAVGGHGDGPQELGGQLAGDEDGGGTVRAADDADGGGLGLAEEAGEAAADKGHEDAQLGGRAQEQGLGVGDEGAEIGARAYAHEDEAGVDAQLHAQVEHVDEAHGDGLTHLDSAQHRVGDPQGAQLIEELLGNGRSAELGPVGVSAGEEDLVVHARARQVRDEHTEGDGQQQQGLELLDDREVEQNEGDDHHDQDLPVPRGDLIEAGLLNEIHDSFHLVFLPVSGLSR